MRQPQTDHVNSTDEIRTGLPTLNPSWEMRNCLHLDLRKTVLVIVRSVVYYANVSANTNKQVFILPKEAFYRVWPEPYPTSHQRPESSRRPMRSQSCGNGDLEPVRVS